MKEDVLDIYMGVYINDLKEEVLSNEAMEDDEDNFYDNALMIINIM